MLEKIETWRTAQILVEARMRLSIVSALTKLSPGHLRKLWHQVHGEGPRNGKLPESALSFVQTQNSVAQLSAYLSLHISMYGKPVLEADSLLKSWRTHQQLCGPLDINAAYYAVLDVRASMLNFVKCGGCNAHFIYDSGMTLTSRCPFCSKSPLA